MNSFTKELVEKYAKDLLIGLTEEENQMVLNEFDSIDANISLINEIPKIENISPMTHALDDFTCALREDICEKSLTIEEVLANAEVVEGREIEVPKVVGNE